MGFLNPKRSFCLTGQFFPSYSNLGCFTLGRFPKKLLEIVVAVIVSVDSTKGLNLKKSGSACGRGSATVMFLPPTCRCRCWKESYWAFCAWCLFSVETRSTTTMEFASNQCLHSTRSDVMASYCQDSMSSRPKGTLSVSFHMTVLISF